MCNVLLGDPSTVIRGKVFHVRMRDRLLIKFQMSTELTLFAENLGHLILLFSSLQGYLWQMYMASVFVDQCLYVHRVIRGRAYKTIKCL